MYRRRSQKINVIIGMTANKIPIVSFFELLRSRMSAPLCTGRIIWKTLFTTGNRNICSYALLVQVTEKLQLIFKKKTLHKKYNANTTTFLNNAVNRLWKYLWNKCKRENVGTVERKKIIWTFKFIQNQYCNLQIKNNLQYI